MSQDNEQTCASLGTPPSPGLMPYRCSQPADHQGACRAELDGRVLDTWPNSHTTPANPANTATP